MNMKKMAAGVTLAALLALPGLSAGASAPAVQPRLIPLTDFFRNPESTGYSLAPDGEHIVYMKPWEKRLNVFVRKVGEQAETRLTDARERDIAGSAWASNHRIVYIRDTGGDENYRLYAVNIDGSGFKELTPFEGVRAGIVDPLEDNDDEMLIRLNRRDPKVFDVYRINVNTGAMELAAENPGNVSEWLTDNDGQLRVAVTTDGVQSSLLYRETEKDPFRTVVTTDFKNTLDPLFFSFDNQRLYVASNIGRDKTAVYLYDVKNAKLLDLIYEHQEADVSGLLRSKARKVITGVAFTPDLYACGIDYVGVSNIFTLLETLPPYWELGRRMMYEMVGDPVKDQELLKQVSPVFHAGRIKAPLLVAQGANDPRVKKAESDQIVQALRQRGVDVDYIVKDNEGHGFHNEENRFDFYRRMEVFLARHLGSRAENPPPA